MEDNPFPDLNISSSDFLNDLDERTECTKCKKTRKYYCYTCYLPVGGTEELVPKVKLPLKIDIIKHPNECSGKSSAVHAAVLAPEDVNIYTYPCIPDYPDNGRTVLVFPSNNSLTIEELAKLSQPSDPSDSENHVVQGDSLVSGATQTSYIDTNDPVVDTHTSSVTNSNSSGDEKSISGSEMHDQKSDQCSENGDCDNTRKRKYSDTETENKKKEGDCDNIRKRKSSDSETDNKKKIRTVCAAPFDRAVFIDSTWNQTRRITSDERLKGLQCIELTTRETKFWRHQKNNPATYLSTVEAIYYLARDYHDLFVAKKYEGEYDNLLFFFKFMYQKIKQTYNGGKDLKAYKERAEKKEQNKTS